MRRIALVNQKGGVGKTTTAVNLGAALAHAGRRVLLVDLDPQGNMSTHLGVEVPAGSPSTYSVLCEGMPIADALVPTTIPGLTLVGTNIDLSGAEMELAAAIGRESILNDAVDELAAARSAADAFDYVIFDCPPSLGLLSVNGLVAAREVFIALQTEFFALQGMSKLVEIVQLLKKRLNPDLEISGIVPCLYDSRLRLAREVLAEIRRYFPGPVFRRSIRANVKLAEAPSYGQSIFEYAPKSPGASDYAELAQEVIAQEAPGSHSAPESEVVDKDGAPSQGAGPEAPEAQPANEPAAPVQPATAPADASAAHDASASDIETAERSVPAPGDEPYHTLHPEPRRTPESAAESTPSAPSANTSVSPTEAVSIEGDQALDATSTERDDAAPHTEPEATAPQAAPGDSPERVGELPRQATNLDEEVVGDHNTPRTSDPDVENDDADVVAGAHHSGYDDTSIETTVVRPRTDEDANTEPRASLSSGAQTSTDTHAPTEGSGDSAAPLGSSEVTRDASEAPNHGHVTERERSTRPPLRASDLPPLPEDAFRTQG